MKTKMMLCKIGSSVRKNFRNWNSWGKSKEKEDKDKLKYS